MSRPGRPAALALALTLLLTACGGGAGEETAAPTATPTPTPTPTQQVGLRTFSLPYSPSGGLHPITGTNRVNLTLAPLLYEGLFAVDRSFEPQKVLCESYSVSEDGLTWTFRLRETTFSDGSPLTGAEAASSLELARKSTLYGDRLKDVARVRAGEGEVTVTLSRPNGALPSLLDIPIVKEPGGDRPLGTGRYVWAEEEGALWLEARETVPAGLERIELWPVGTGEDLVYAFDANEISLVATDLTGTNALGWSGRYETTDYPTTTLLYVGLNLTSGPCTETAVRRAVSAALDRQTVAGRLLAGHAVAAALPIHPHSALYDTDLAEPPAEERKSAREILSEGGWTWDEEGRLRKGRSGLTLRLAVNQDNTYKVAVAEELAEELTALGCVVTVDKLPWDDFVSALEKGKFDLYLGETTLTADFDLAALLAPGGSLNYGGCADGTLTTLMDAFRASGEGERKGAASALCARVQTTVPIIPLCFKNGSLLTQWGQVRGAEPTQRDVFAGLENWDVE